MRAVVEARLQCIAWSASQERALPDPVSSLPWLAGLSGLRAMSSSVTDSREVFGSVQPHPSVRRTSRGLQIPLNG